MTTDGDTARQGRDDGRDGSTDPTAGIGLERQGPTAVIRLCHPPAHAWTRRGAEVLKARLAELSCDGGVYALVITGEGDKFFSAGADLKLFSDGDKAGGPAMVRSIRRGIRGLVGVSRRHHRGHQRLRDGRRSGMRARLRPPHRRGTRADGPARGHRRPAAVRRRHAVAAVAGRRGLGQAHDPVRRAHRCRHGAAHRSGRGGRAPWAVAPEPHWPWRRGPRFRARAAWRPARR